MRHLVLEMRNPLNFQATISQEEALKYFRDAAIHNRNTYFYKRIWKLTHKSLCFTFYYTFSFLWHITINLDRKGLTNLNCTLCISEQDMCISFWNICDEYTRIWNFIISTKIQQQHARNIYFYDDKTTKDWNNNSFNIEQMTNNSLSYKYCMQK